MLAGYSPGDVVWRGKALFQNTLWNNYNSGREGRAVDISLSHSNYAVLDGRGFPWVPLLSWKSVAH